MSNITIPSSPVDQKKLKSGIEEIVASMIRADSEKDYQKESIQELSEAFSIEKKHIARMARDHFKDQFDQKAAEFDDYSTLYETIMKMNSDNSPEQDDDED